jgi:hypothetical protein
LKFSPPQSLTLSDTSTADGIESFATKMADPKFRDYVASFAKDAVEAAVLVEVVGKAIAVGVAGFSIAGALRWGPAVAIGGAAVAGGKAFADAPGHALGGSGWDAAKRLWNRLPGYAEGAWNLPKDQLAVVHKGEMVVPAATAETIRQLSDADPNTLNPVADDNSGFKFGNKRRRGPIVKGHQWMHYKAGHPRQSGRVWPEVSGRYLGNHDPTLCAHR